MPGPSTFSTLSPSSSATPMDLDPMDVDPIDGGPKPASPGKLISSPPVLNGVATTITSTTQQQQQQQQQQQPGSKQQKITNSGPIAAILTTTISKEEEARQAIEMMRNDDVSSRVAAANRLDSIAAVLGQERTRNELLPFVTEGLDDEDEVLLALSQSLGRMVELVGGPKYAHLLLQPIELLLSVEEITVREAAAKSAQAIAEHLPIEKFYADYAEMLARLAMKEWFTARISAAGLIALAYAKFDDQTQLQRDHLNFFVRLCKDETSMVRRVAAQYLGTMVRNVCKVMGRTALDENGVVVTALIPLFEQFASTDQPDSVRLQTTANCVVFGEVMTEIGLNNTPHPTTSPQQSLLRPCEIALLQRILPLVVATIDDRSWRVRWTAAAKFAAVITAYDPLPDAMDSLVPAYEKLLQDPEAEVRAAATFNLAFVAKCKARVPLPPPPINRPPQDGDNDGYNNITGPRVSVAERLVKRITTLTEDDSEHVRAALAMVATELAPILGKDATITYLVPPVLLLLRDAASEVRLNLISSLGALNEVIGVDLLSQSLLPAILDLAQDGKWRIRLAIIQHIPLLAKQLGRDFFTEKLSSMCVGWLGDDIASIRLAAATNLGELTALFGTDWAIQFLLPSIIDIRQHDSYLRRLTALQACAVMATKMNKDSARLHILPLVLEMSSDIVPNIRFNVAKELQRMTPVCGFAAYESQVLPVLTVLMDDDDRDVRFFAEKAVTFLDEFFVDGA